MSTSYISEELFTAKKGLALLQAETRELAGELAESYKRLASLDAENEQVSAELKAATGQRVEILGGKISVLSEINRGTTFRV